MTERQKRLVRLAQLRERQHDHTLHGVRLANHYLHIIDQRIDQCSLQTQMSQTEQVQALLNGSSEDWLLARAGYEVACAQRVRAAVQRPSAEHAVMEAAKREAVARRELRQMERILDRMQKEDWIAAVRKEQQQLDESARLLRTHSSSQRLSLGTA